MRGDAPVTLACHTHRKGDQLACFCIEVRGLRAGLAQLSIPPDYRRTQSPDSADGLEQLLPVMVPFEHHWLPPFHWWLTFTRVARATSLLSSLSHSTELATAVQRAQSSIVKGTVPNARCRNGTYTTAIWSASESAIAAQSHPFVNKCENALSWSDLALITLKI